MEEKIILVSAGGIDAIKPEIILQLNEKFGAEGYIVVDPKNLKQHIPETKTPSFERSIPIINTHELLPEVKLKEPNKPIDAILKNKKYK
jgi:4-hydroxy-L-threonine phosphate dehydrogenase PdxA